MSTIGTDPLKPPFACPLCGGVVERLAVAGRTRRVAALQCVPVPADLAIATCVACSTEWLDAAAALAVDQAMAGAYRRELTRLAASLIGQLRAANAEGQSERALGLTRGYLSRLAAGRRVPSAALVADLALLAAEPAGRLKELQQFWAEAG